MPKLRTLLLARGYQDVSQDDASDWNFVLGDGQDHEVDVHSYALDDQGKHIYGTEYPADALTGTGSIDGRAVRCISAERMVQFRTGYALREIDIRNVEALHERYGIPIPEEFEGLANQPKRGERLTGVLRTLCPIGRRTTIVAIDGYGGSGKSTLAGRIAAVLSNVTVVRTDDFSRPRVSGLDWQRMKAQVLDPLNANRAGRYQRYDWPTDRLAEWHSVPVGGIVVVEGVSSMRTELGPYWDLAVWVTCSYERRLARGIARDGEGKRAQWEKVWMPEEDTYVRAQHPDKRANVIINGEEPFVV